jgi:hypothetical protein
MFLRTDVPGWEIHNHICANAPILDFVIVGAILRNQILTNAPELLHYAYIS